MRLYSYFQATINSSVLSRRSQIGLEEEEKIDCNSQKLTRVNWLIFVLLCRSRPASTLYVIH